MLSQFCGIDSESPKTIPLFSLDANRQAKFPFLSSHVDKIASGVQGMVIKSKCFDYVTDGKRCPRSGYYDRMPRIIDKSNIDYKDVSGNVYNPFKLVKYPRYPRKEDADDFCGKIESWAPARREWAGSVTPTASEEALAEMGIEDMEPASCTKQVKVKIKGADECNYMGSYFTVPKTTCDQEWTDADTCREACEPPGEYLSWSTDCTAESLEGDELKFCTCLRECNSCVNRNGGCDADDPNSDDGHCGECLSSSPAPPPPTTPTSAFVCSLDDAPGVNPLARHCKSACRGCLTAAMKTSCQCHDKTGSEEYDTSFGQCSSLGSFHFRLDKGDADYGLGSELTSSQAFQWYLDQNLIPASVTYDSYSRDNWERQGGRSLVSVRFESPAIAWEGHCDGTSTTCKVCNDLDGSSSSYLDSRYRNLRCVDGFGIPQECRGGRWVRIERPSTAVSPVLPGLPTETAPVVICFLVCGILASIVVIITSCLWCASMAAQSSSKLTSASTASAQLGMNLSESAAPAAPPINVSPPPPSSTIRGRPTYCNACGTERRLDSTRCTVCGAAPRQV